MKRIVLSLILIVIGFALKAQVPISQLPVTTNPSGYIPLARNGYTYKVLTDSIAAGKLDSLKVSNDTLYSYSRGVRTFVGVIVGGSGSSIDTTSLSNRINLKLNITDTTNKWLSVGWLTSLMKYTDTASKTWDWNDITGKPNVLLASDTTSKTWDWSDITGKPSLIVAGDTASMLNPYLRKVDTANIKPRLYAGSNVTITGTYPNLTISSTGGGGSSDSSTLFVDTTYNRLAHHISTDSLMLKSARIQLNGSDVTPTVTDSTISWNIQALVAADTASLSSRINLKVNISDTASMLTNYVRRQELKDTAAAIRSAIGSGGGSSPAGNYGNVQLNRNGAFATPASDSLNFSAGLAIKGTLSATALPTGGVAADSVVVVSSAGALKKRNSSSFVTTNGSTATGQFALFNGSGTVYSSSRFVYNDASYPYMGIIGSDPIMYFGAISNNNPIVGSGAGLSLYGGDTYESVNILSKITGGQQMARFYATSPGIMWNILNGNVVASTTYSPSNEQGAYTVQRTVGYGINVNTHGFTDETNFQSQSAAFNSFGSFVKFGNSRNTQDHYAAFQSVWRKDSVNQVNKVYDFIAGTSTVTGGTIDSLFRMRIFPVNNTGGTINVEYGIWMPTGSATTKYGAYIEDNVGIGTATPSEKLHVNGAIKTATSGSGSGAWKLGVAVSSSGLTLVTDQYVEISIGGTVYKLALVNAP